MENKIKEGDLYRVLNVFGRSFELRYGYYDECERFSPVNEVVPIYPNFIESPLYNDEGYPFVTQMQDICEHYEGRNDGEDCHGCMYFCHGEDLIGICSNIRRKKENRQKNTNKITS